MIAIGGRVGFVDCAGSVVGGGLLAIGVDGVVVVDGIVEGVMILAFCGKLVIVDGVAIVVAAETYVESGGPGVETCGVAATLCGDTVDATGSDGSDVVSCWRHVFAAGAPGAVEPSKL